MHRVFGVKTWADRLTRLAPVGSVVQELVRFDTQKMQNPELSGVEYQQGELFRYEVREYLLEKWGRKCAYCSVSDVPTGTGAQTKFNRCRLNLPKEHWIDAACIGQVDTVKLATTQPLLIKSTGYGSHQVIQIDKYGFPRKGYQVKLPVKDWKTGDIVNVVADKNAGLRGVRLKTVRAKTLAASG